MSGLIESWIESANDPEGGFPLNNLPYGVASVPGDAPRCVSALGDWIIDLSALDHLIGVDGAFAEPALNHFMAMGPSTWKRVRASLVDLFAVTGPTPPRAEIKEHALHPFTDCILYLPFQIAEYTDFYAGRHHATNVGTMFRGPENALPPNWLHMPIGYNGRASTVVVSGTPITRPCGQLNSPEHENPIFAPSRRLDIELEMGAIIGGSSPMGERLSVRKADDMIFGYVLLNDWSARDIQAWEYQPLGPFQAKAFATSISPWIVTKEALEPFRVSTPDREKPLLDYLHEPGPMLYDIDLEIGITSTGAQETIISRTNYREMYYSAAQQIAHHSSSGCAMNIGDLTGSGTISGPSRDQCGSFLEITWGGKEPLSLPNGETRTFLEDGDTVILRGHAKGDGYRIGFGECRGKILPAND
ncbi:MAG: fumarylacetoacetase [Rhizobiaceae bacterium]